MDGAKRGNHAALECYTWPNMMSGYRIQHSHLVGNLGNHVFRWEDTNDLGADSSGALRFVRPFTTRRLRLLRFVMSSHVFYNRGFVHLAADIRPRVCPRPTPSPTKRATATWMGGKGEDDDDLLVNNRSACNEVQLFADVRAAQDSEAICRRCVCVSVVRN